MPPAPSRIFELKGSVRNYPWGGYDFIPDLLGIPNRNRQPFAEYWLGAHPQAPSRILEEGKDLPLDQMISESRGALLGPKAQGRFGQLPYLLKILDVREMLSIQVHPSRQEAEKGFIRENLAGIPLDAPNRNYRDTNHKPEVMVALSEFWLLHGFRPVPRLVQVLREIPEFRSLIPVFEKEGYFGLYREVMEMDGESLRHLLQPLLGRVMRLDREGRLQKHDPAFWAARALTSGMTTMDQPDRGIFSIYFFNIVRLLPGEGIFQAAGVPHAYLEGRNVELMASSDNVLRGGLTSKHVDSAELLRRTLFSETIPQVLLGYATQEGMEKTYSCPVPDFSLSSIHLHTNEPYRGNSGGADLVLVLSGSVVVTGSRNLTLARGQSFIAFCGEQYQIQRQEEALLFRASIPEVAASGL